MRRSERWDAVVVGAGPNGLSAALTLARAGRSVLVVEARDSVGGGLRSAGLTAPGFVHDVCSSVHPLAVVSPALRAFGLERYGVRWVHPEVPLAHPFDDEEAALLFRSLDDTTAELGSGGESWRALLAPAARAARAVSGADPARPSTWLRVLGHALRSLGPALSSTSVVARERLASPRARALFAGLAAHSMLPLERRPSAGFGLALGALAHAVGWPFPEGGAASLSDALALALQHQGGVIETGREVRSLDELPPSRAYLLDVSPSAAARLCGDRLPARFRRALTAYRYGPGACKVDYALRAPIPWRDPRCRRAGTVHLGGTLEELERSERGPWCKELSAAPFVLLAQTSLFDATRAPPGGHTAWAYCHVPHGSDDDASAALERQIERFAPGFGDVVLARHVFTARELEAYNPNYVGGDINTGVMDVGQVLRRPTWRAWSTPLPDVWLCSAATPPGGGVHGLCGALAAEAVLRSGRLG